MSSIRIIDNRGALKTGLEGFPAPGTLRTVVAEQSPESLDSLRQFSLHHPELVHQLRKKLLVLFSFELNSIGLKRPLAAWTFQQTKQALGQLDGVQGVLAIRPKPKPEPKP